MTSGWGDGIYPTWLGLDDMNEVSMVVVDFLLNSEPPLPVDKPAARPPGLFASLWSTITNRP